MTQDVDMSGAQAGSGQRHHPRARPVPSLTLRLTPMIPVEGIKAFERAGKLIEEAGLTGANEIFFSGLVDALRKFGFAVAGDRASSQGGTTSPAMDTFSRELILSPGGTLGSERPRSPHVRAINAAVRDAFAAYSLRLKVDFAVAYPDAPSGMFSVLTDLLSTLPLRLTLSSPIETVAHGVFVPEDALRATWLPGGPEQFDGAVAYLRTIRRHGIPSLTGEESPQVLTPAQADFARAVFDHQQDVEFSLGGHFLVDEAEIPDFPGVNTFPRIDDPRPTKKRWDGLDLDPTQLIAARALIRRSTVLRRDGVEGFTPEETPDNPYGFSIAQIRSVIYRHREARPPVVADEWELACLSVDMMTCDMGELDTRLLLGIGMHEMLMLKSGADQLRTEQLSAAVDASLPS